MNPNYLKTLLVTAAFLLPGTALAQDDFGLDEDEVVEPAPIYTSWIELGIGWQSQDSYKFGEFSGLTDRGPFVVGNFFISRRPAWDSTDTQYFTLTGTNLGLDSRFVSLEYGKQGSFKIFASFDQTPKFLFSDGMTPYIIDPTGTSLTLPSTWVPNDRNAQTLTQLNNNLNPVSVEHDRQKFSGGFAWNLSKHWKITTKYYHENKQGTRTIGAIFGSSGGDPGGAIIPEPVDYETDNIDVALEYVGDQAMFSLAYNFSNFNDNNSSVTFQNPFSSSRWDAPANYPTGFGRLATPPDNKASRITFSGGYVFSPKTRANVNLVYIHATQNEPYLPYTVNPNLVVTIPLPQSSLMGEIDTVMATVGLNSRLSNRLTAGFDFRFEDRDNNTPQNIYVYTHGDSHNQDPTLITDDARINIPYDRQQLRFKANLNYRVSGDIKLGVIYTYEQLERTYAEVTKTKEHSIEGKLRFTPTQKTFGWFGVTFADRTGTGYIHNALFLQSHNPDWIEEEGEEFENHPLTRKFFIADRERISFDGAFNWLPSDEVVVGIFGHFTRDDYNQSILGLLENKTGSGTFDVSYSPTDVFSAHGYVTYESLMYNQASYTYRPGNPLDDFAARLWTADTHDEVVTFGFGFDWQAIKDKLKFVADFSYSDATTNFFLTGGTAVAFLQLPDLKSKLVAVEAKMDYQFRPNIILRATYWFQDLNVTDWALDGVNPDTMSLVIGLGNSSPNYNVHLLGFSGIFQF